MPGQPSSHSSRHSALVHGARLGVLAHALGLRALGQQLARRALDLALVLRQAEVHQLRDPAGGARRAKHIKIGAHHAATFRRGSPSTRSATMFLSTSVVPPSIVLPRARISS